MTKRKSVAIYNPYLHTKGGGEKVCLALAESLKNDLGYNVTLITSTPVDFNELAQYFKLDLQGMNQELVTYDSLPFRVINRLRIPGKLRNIFYDKEIIKVVRSGGFDMFVNNCYQSNLPSPIKNGTYMCMFPQRLNTPPSDTSVIRKAYLRFASRLSQLILHPKYTSPIDTYRKIISNSSYTQSYVKEYWNKETEILYPICEDMSKLSVEKEKIILHVGRFFENVGESHHKRQDALVANFTALTDLHQQGWKLHLVGSVAEDIGGLKYILSLMKQASGYPVFFHFNASFTELVELYNKASIYWHATGLGSDPEKHPEKQEHFGISTVEAMSTGAIPVVINSAGQKETVSNEVNGYLWDTQDELENYTKKITEMDAEQLISMRDAAKNSSRQFNKDAFRKQVSDLFS